MTEARVPTKGTLRKYGLDVEMWWAILERQGGACGVCGTVPDSGTLHIDHDHVRGYWKRPAEQRRLYVRGLVCWFDNSVLLRRGASPERLRAAAQYLEAYEKRLTATLTK